MKAKAYRESASVERPPAFQEYAAAALSAESILMMPLAERGLFWTMRLYCWVNDSLPSDPDSMARVLGIPADELRRVLTDRVRGFFQPAEDKPDRLICVALVRQMEKLLDRREKQAAGGRDAAKSRRLKKNSAIGNRDSNHAGTNASVENSTAQSNSTQLGNGGISTTPGNGGVQDPWLEDYEKTGG